MNKHYAKGNILSITMKPVLLREWEYVRRTKKCIVVNKTRGGKFPYRGEVYLPIKDIQGTMVVKKVKE